MTSKELFKKWKEWIIIECPCDRNDVDELNQIERDLELLDSLLDVFKKDILEAFDSYYRDGDNIITKYLIDQLGMVTLKKLKERINKNDK